MKYLIGLLVVLFAVAVALKVPVYRAAAWVIAGGLLLLGGAFFLLQKSPPPVVSDKPTQEEINDSVQADALLWQIVKPEQVTIIPGGKLTPTAADDDRHAMNYAGQIKNLSDHGIDKVALRIRLYDCPGKPPANWVGCLIIDDDTQNIPIQLGAHQTVALAGLFQFHHFRESTGHFAIRPEINRIHAAPTAAQ